MDIHSQQQEDLRTNTTGTLWSCGCWLSRTKNDVGIDQIELLVARNQGRHKEICSGMPQILAEQSATLKKSRRITPIGDTIRTLARNQH